MEKKKPFYGWIIVAAATLVMAVGIGIFGGTNSAFVKPICENLGLPRGEFTLYRTIISLIGALCMPLYAALLRKIGVKKLLLATSVGIALSYVFYSLASSLWHFYAIAFWEGIFTNGISFLTIGTIVGNWFEEKQGIATGIAFAGSGLGGAVFIPVVGWFIEKIGWRWTYRGMALIGLMILLPVIALLIRDTPRQMGLTPYRGTETVKREEQKGAQPGITLRAATRTLPFWLLLVGFFLNSVCCGGPYTHTTAYFSDLGYTTALATSVTSAYMVFLTVGKVTLGGLYDRFGTVRTTLFLGLCCVGFPVLALLGRVPFAPWAYALLMGFASSGCSVAITVLTSSVFGALDFAAIYSIMSMASTFGTAVSVPVMGVIYDVSGSYAASWVALLALAVLMAACLVGALWVAGKKNADAVQKA